MYIKLTRMDGAPIWLNAAFVVTIEPHRRSGGSLVVPIGDGLDYEVKESPETVLAMLDGAPVPAVVPIPCSDALTATPDDVSPEESIPEEDVPSAEDATSLDVFKSAKAGEEKTKPAKKNNAQTRQVQNGKSGRRRRRPVEKRKKEKDRQKQIKEEKRTEA